MAFGNSFESSMDDFISFLPPLGNTLDNYLRTAPPHEQPDSIPRIFLDAMSVREAVFVNEQHVELERELDADDARAYHWVAYASVSRRKSSGTASLGNLPESSSQQSQNQNGDGHTTHSPPHLQTESSGHRESTTSTAMRIPVGTIRLLPPLESGTHTAQIAPHPTAHTNEPYVLLGRLAVIEAYRTLGLGRLLIKAALDWVRVHGAETFSKTLSPAEIEARKLEGGYPNEDPIWRGLVVVHAQKGDHAEVIWKKLGFTRDKGMGEWEEEGIRHVGMWKRVDGVVSR